MHNCLITNHNNIVTEKDTTIHAGDFSLGRRKQTWELVDKLNGKHIFLRGSHDYWFEDNSKTRWEKMVNGNYIVVDHYCMRTWSKSHFNSWHLFGHSHGTLEPIGKSWDISVDNNNFKPLSVVDIEKIMEKRPDNFNLIKRNRR